MRFLAAISMSAALLLSGCTVTLECGEGTHQEGDQCVPNIPQNCTSDNVVFRDGRCQPRPSVCAEGSEFDLDAGVCVRGDDPDPNPDPQPTDTGPEDVIEDVPDEDILEDVPDVPPPPACGPDSPEGTICISGGVLDWSTNQPIDTEETLAIIIDDLMLRSVDPLKAPFGQALLEPRGAFVLDEVAIASGDGPLAQMILVAGAPPDAPPSKYQRTLTGINAVVASGQSYPNTPAFLVPEPLVTAWNATLGLEGADGLDATGFLLVRVLANTDNGLVPVEGATVQNAVPSEDQGIEKHYLDNDLISFRDEATTGPSGAVLLIGAPVGNYTASAQSLTFNTTLGGTSPGLAITTVIIGVVE